MTISNPSRQWSCTIFQMTSILTRQVSRNSPRCLAWILGSNASAGTEPGRDAFYSVPDLKRTEYGDAVESVPTRFLGNEVEDERLHSFRQRSRLFRHYRFRHVDRPHGFRDFVSADDLHPRFEGQAGAGQ